VGFNEILLFWPRLLSWKEKHHCGGLKQVLKKKERREGGFEDE